MFIVKEVDDATVDWPVSVNVPQAGGKSRKYEFTGVFRRLNADEKDELGKAIAGDLETTDDYVAQFVERTMGIMVGWRDIVDTEQKQIEFSAENLRRILRSSSGSAIIVGINRAILDVDLGEKRKN